jgi:hypothetical protein
LGDFGVNPAGSITPPHEDKLSANVNRKFNLEIFPPFFLYMNAFRQTKQMAEHLVVVLL